MRGWRKLSAPLKVQSLDYQESRRDNEAFRLRMCKESNEEFSRPHGAGGSCKPYRRLVSQARLAAAKMTPKNGDAPNWQGGIP